MKQRLKIMTIVVLVIVDLIAITLAVRHSSQMPPASVSSKVPLTSTPSSAKTTTPPPEAASPTGLSVVGNSIGRFAAGTCDGTGSAKLEVSADGGSTFAEVALPLAAKTTAGGKQATAVARILSLDLASATEMTLIGDSAACKPSSWTTSDAGKSWKQASSSSDWYIDGNKVGTLAGEVDSGCEPVSVAAVSDRNAKVACKDSKIRGTDDAGQTWVALGSLDGVVSVSFETVANGVAVAKTSKCAAQSYSTGSAGGSWQETGCIDTKTPASAIGGTSALLAALVGPKTLVSVDQGATWKEAQ